MTTVRLERRLHVGARRSGLIRIIGAVIALLVAGVILQLTGRPALSLGADALESTFGRRLGLDETGVIATPILLSALAVAVGLRARIWNIGSEGQFYMGAWAATGIGIHLDAPAPVLIALMAVAGALAGAAWIAIAAVARAYWNVNEIITTLLLNFVAIQWVEWFSIDLWRDTEAAVVRATPEVNAELPGLFGSQVLHVGFLVPIVLAFVLWWVFRFSRWGYEVDMTGGNPRAAQFAGVNVGRRIVSVMLLSGAIAGLSGMIHLVGVTHRLQGTISNQYGLSGFIVAALAGASILALMVGGLAIAVLLHAGIALQGGGLSVYIVLAVYGTVLLGIAVAEVASRFRLVVQGNSPRRRIAAPAEEAP